MKTIHGLVAAAQERRADEAHVRGRAKVPHLLEVGDTVLLQRTPKLGDEPVSRKLMPRARTEAFQIIWQPGPSNFVLGQFTLIG